MGSCNAPLETPTQYFYHHGKWRWWYDGEWWVHAEAGFSVVPIYYSHCLSTCTARATEVWGMADTAQTGWFPWSDDDGFDLYRCWDESPPPSAENSEREGAHGSRKPARQSKNRQRYHCSMPRSPQAAGVAARPTESLGPPGGAAFTPHLHSKKTICILSFHWLADKVPVDVVETLFAFF